MLHRNAFWYGLGTLILGIVGIVVGDFALQWQPVPAGVPLRSALAYLSAALLVAVGISLILEWRLRQTLLLASAFYAAWVVLLHVPKVIGNPSQLHEWNGLAELLAITAGGVAGWTLTDTPAAGSVIARTARLAFGACLLIFGACHFVYDDFSATMIPAWLPVPLFWVYLTGAGHAAAGLSFLSGIALRLASTLLPAMLACFALLLHIPRVVTHPAVRIEWTMLGISLTLTGAAWLLRAAILHRSDV